MRITTTVDVDAGMLTVEVEGRLELLPSLLAELPEVVTDAVAYAIATQNDRLAWPGESRWRALRLLKQGMTDQQVAETIGVDVEQVRRWDDDAAIDGYHDQLADALGVS